MATYTYLGGVPQQYFNDSGAVLASGTVESFVAGTATHAATYSDVSGTQNANPLSLNAAGRPQSGAILLLAGQSYDFVFKTSAGVTVSNPLNYAAVPGSAATLDVVGTAGETLPAGKGAYLSRGDGGKVQGSWYLWDSANAYSSTLPQIGLVPNLIAIGTTGTIRQGGIVSGLTVVAGTDYYVGSAGALTLSLPANARLVGRADTVSSLDIGMPPVPMIDVGLCQGRLTLTAAVPVTTADVTAATTFYFTPLGRGNRIALYDGTSWSLRSFAEISLAVPASTSQLYDVYVYDNGGTLTLELTAWTNDTTRATALVLQDGVYVKTGVTTRRWLGCIRTTAVSGQTEDSKAKRYLYNFYNQVDRQMRVTEPANSYPYDTATYRQMNANTANQLDVVIGQVGALLKATVQSYYADGGANINLAVSIGEDSTTAPLSGVMGQSASSTASGVAAGSPLSIAASLVHYPAMGRHTYVALERGGGGTTTWYGDNNDPTRWQSGISGSVWM